MILNVTGIQATEEIASSFMVKDPIDSNFVKKCQKMWAFDKVPDYNDLADRADEFVDLLLAYQGVEAFSKILLPESPAWFISHVTSAVYVEDIIPCFISNFNGKLGLIQEE